MDSELSSVSEWLGGKSDAMEADSFIDCFLSSRIVRLPGSELLLLATNSAKKVYEVQNHKLQLYSIQLLKFSSLTQNSFETYLEQLCASAYRPWKNNSGRLI